MRFVAAISQPHRRGWRNMASDSLAVLDTSAVWGQDRRRRLGEQLAGALVVGGV